MSAQEETIEQILALGDRMAAALAETAKRKSHDELWLQWEENKPKWAAELSQVKA